jgi:hypothetical protein
MNVSIDCMRKAHNFEVLGEMGCLRILSLGVDEMDFPGILALPSLQGLEELRLGETKSHPVNLDPLAAYRKLRHLTIAAQTKEIEKIVHSSSIETLGLCMIKKNVRLEFLNQMNGLRSLTLVLGGRSNIHEVKHHALTKLAVIRVMGFEAISLKNFPALEELKIEDQIRLKNINMIGAAKQLRKVSLLNCKSLDSLNGFSELPGLEHLRIAKTALDFDKLINDGIPSTLRIFAFYDRSKPKTKSIRARLDKLGYKEFSWSGTAA